MRGFDVMLAIDPRLLDMFRGGAGRGFGIDFLRFIDDDALELGFLVEEIRDVKERVALQSDIHKGRLHAGQHAHYAAFVDIPDDALILFAAFDVKLSNAVILDDRDLLFATINTNN